MMFKLSKLYFISSHLMLIPVDTLILFSSILVPLELFSSQNATMIYNTHNIIFTVLPFIAVVQICCYYSGLYDTKHLSFARIFLKVIIALAFASAIMAAAYYFLPSIELEKNIFLSSILASSILLSSVRVLYLVSSGSRHKKQRIIIIGTGQKAKEVAALIRTKNGKKYDLLGFIDTDEKLEKSVSNLAVVHNGVNKQLSETKRSVEPWKRSIGGLGIYHSSMQRDATIESETIIKRKIDVAWIKRRILDKG